MVTEWIMVGFSSLATVPLLYEFGAAERWGHRLEVMTVNAEEVWFTTAECSGTVDVVWVAASGTASGKYFVFTGRL